MLGAVGEEEIDDKADDGEDEDAQAPQQLGYGRAVGLEDLDCVGRKQMGQQGGLLDTAV